MLVVLVMHLGASRSFAQSSHAAQPSTVDLNERITLEELVALAAEANGVRIEFEPQTLPDRSRVRGPTSLQPDGLWSLMHDALLRADLTTVRSTTPATYVVLRTADAARWPMVEESVLPGVSSSPPADPGPRPLPGPLPGFSSVLIPIPIELDPAQVVAAITPILTQGVGTARAAAGGRHVFLQDLTARTEAARIVLAELASSKGSIVTRSVTLTHTTAPLALDRLTTILDARQVAGGLTLPGQLVLTDRTDELLLVCPPPHVAGWLKLVPLIDVPDERSTRSYTASIGPTLLEQTIRSSLAPSGLDTAVTFAVDEVTGTLFVNATTSIHQQIRPIVEGIAQRPAGDDRSSRTFIIRHRPASELATVIESLLEAPSEPATAQSASSRDGSVDDTDEMFEAPIAAVALVGVAVTVDEASNALIAIGQRRQLERIARLVADLDASQPQVQLEVLIVSLSEGDTLDLGIEMNALIRSGSIQARLSSLFGLSQAGDGVDRTVGDASGFAGVILSPGEFAVVLRALETINDGRTLSMPRVVVSNNQEASLNSVLQQPFTSTNASDTVATTSFGGTQDAGTTVALTPRISPADHLLLEYSVSLSSFVGESADPSIPPPRQQNELASVVTIPDGFTIALGGIELTTEAEAESRLPLIGSIPLLGELAKNRSRSASRQRFYVFIRPTILRATGFEDLRYLSDVQLDEAGLDDGWPVVEPRVIR